MNDLAIFQATLTQEEKKNRQEHGRATLTHNELAEDEKVASACCLCGQNEGTWYEATKQCGQERQEEVWWFFLTTQCPDKI